MTRWAERTLDEQTAYIGKVYSRSPIRSLEGRIVHEQTEADVMRALVRFDAWLAAVKAEAAAEQREKDAQIAEQQGNRTSIAFGWQVATGIAAAIRSGVQEQ